MKTVTSKELEMLKDIYNDQNTDSCGNYKVETNEEKGLIGSLVKKDLVFDAFEGDVFSIVYSDLSVNYMATNISLIELGCKVFSTIEKANDYIIENKACLSLNEIENILGKYFYVDVIYHNLYKLIEEKLNIK